MLECSIVFCADRVAPRYHNQVAYLGEVDDMDAEDQKEARLRLKLDLEDPKTRPQERDLNSTCLVTEWNAGCPLSSEATRSSKDGRFAERSLSSSRWASTPGWRVILPSFLL